MSYLYSYRDLRTWLLILQGTQCCCFCVFTRSTDCANMAAPTCMWILFEEDSIKQILGSILKFLVSKVDM